MTIKVIGAGFGRTGTLSLKTALEALGFARCYHMEDVFFHPHHARRWLNAYRGTEVNWESLLRGYQATVDWPACTFYQAFMDHNPDAKVILTVRDPEKWYESTTQTIYSTIHRFPLNGAGRFLPLVPDLSHMLHEIIWQGTFHGKFADKQYAIDIFKRHNEEVIRTVPAERLLVYDVSQGWEPLCRFLNVPVPPGKIFPHRNHRDDFQRKIQLLKLGLSAGIGSALLLAGAGLWWMFSRKFS